MLNNPIIKFEHFDSVSNPNSMHGIYPYRGKISALDAASIISQLPKTGTLLDPFCGSGTIVYEAQKHGLTALGVDNNPLAIQIAKAKVFKGTKESLELCESIVQKATEYLNSNEVEEMPEAPLRSFHVQTAKEIMAVKKFFDEMDDYLKGVFYGTIALAARACNGYMWTSSTVGKNIEPKTYCNFFNKFVSKAKKHAKFFASESSENATIISGDSRRLSELIPAGSVDYVFTSPPYFDGLDYTAYYGKLIYEIFEVNRLEIKKELIQYVDTYENDMREVLRELDIVTSDNALIVFVVGDKKIGGKVINGGEFFSNIKSASYIHERSYSGSASAIFDEINKTDRKEQIVVWDKRNGKVITYE